MNLLNAALCSMASLLLSAYTYATPASNQLFSAQRSISFIENKGQVTDQDGKPRTDIDFKINTPAVSVFIGDGRLHYQWSKPQEPSTKPKPGEIPPVPATIDMYRLDIELVGANKSVVPETADAQEMYENYYLPQCPDGITAHSYNKVIYRNIYPNIDWVLYTKDNALKYDFIVHPGGNAALIRLRYNGATSLELKDGDIVAKTPMGMVKENKPYSYNAGTRAEIASSFSLRDNMLSFNIHTNANEFVIDPKWEWGTYYGGPGWESYGTGSTDENGNTYVTGTTNSTTNIATTGAFQTTLLGSTTSDGFIAKFSPSGSLLWATYHGNTGYDYFYGSIIDIHNSIYIVGMTTSSGIATPGAFKTVRAGYNDYTIVKFNSSGARIWATYYGVSGTEGVNGSIPGASPMIATDKHANIFIAMNALPDTGLTTPGAYRPSGGRATNNCVLAKFDSLGNRIWGTYIGDTALNKSTTYYNLHVDNRENCYLFCLDSTYRFTNAGMPVWRKYNAEYFSDILSDTAGNFYVTGSTLSTSGIATPGCWQPTNKGSSDAFLMKYDSSWTKIWGTYAGSTGMEGGQSLDLDENGVVYLVGNTNSYTGMAVSGAHQQYLSLSATNNATDDVFIQLYKAVNGGKIWSTYYGGDSLDWSNHIKYWNGAIFFSGLSYSTNKIASASSYQSTISGIDDAFLAKFSVREDTTVYIDVPADTSVCQGDTLSIYYDVVNTFRSGNTFTFQLSDATGDFTTPITLGSQSGTAGGVFKYQVPSTVPVGLGYKIRILASAPYDTSADDGRRLAIGMYPQNVVATTNSPVCSGDSLKFNATTTTVSNLIKWVWTSTTPRFTSQDTFITNAQLADSGRYIVDASIYGCATRDTVRAIMRQSPLPVLAVGNSPLCAGDTIKLSAVGSNSNAAYAWTGPSGYSVAVKDTFITATIPAMSGNYTVSSTLNGCTKRSTVAVYVYAYPDDIAATATSPICQGNVATLNATTAVLGTTFKWDGPASFTSTAQSPTIMSVNSANAGDYIVTATNVICTRRDTVSLTVLPTPVITATTANSPVCGGQTLRLTATASNATGYLWSGPSGFVAYTQNPTIPNVTSAAGGSYTVIAYNAACSSAVATVNVTTATGPVTSIYPRPGDSICAGATVSINAIPPSGITPQYQWYKNNVAIPSATSVSYTTNVVTDKDAFFCTITTTGVCADPFVDTSNIIPINVLPWMAPSVTIAANPNTPVSGGQMINFTATPKDAGKSPTYQWKRNGVDIIGAVSNTWGANNLDNHDTICVVVNSNYRCPSPASAKSNCIVVEINTTGIDNTTLLNGVSIYPNPVTNELIIDGITDKTTIQLFDVIGKLVYTTRATGSKETINTASLAAGTYMLQLVQPDGQKLNAKITKQ